MIPLLRAAQLLSPQNDGPSTYALLSCHPQTDGSSTYALLSSYHFRDRRFLYLRAAAAPVTSKTDDSSPKSHLTEVSPELVRPTHSLLHSSHHSLPRTSLLALLFSHFSPRTSPLLALLSLHFSPHASLLTRLSSHVSRRASSPLARLLSCCISLTSHPSPESQLVHPLSFAISVSSLLTFHPLGSQSVRRSQLTND